MQISKKPYAIERIVSAGSYITAGGLGFVWFIIALLLKKRVTPFLMYHMMQSIFLSILSFLIFEFSGYLGFIIKRIPIICNIPVLLNHPIGLFFGLSIIQLFTTVIILYLTLTAFMGYYSYLPWVSDIIKGNVSSK